MNATAEKLPTIAQMKNRAHQGHMRVLERLAAGESAFDSYPIPEAAVPSTLKGRRIVLDTLSRWECIDVNGITQRGRDLLASSGR